MIFGRNAKQKYGPSENLFCRELYLLEKLAVLQKKYFYHFSKLCGSRKIYFVDIFVDLSPMTSDSVSSLIDRFC